MHKSYPSSHSPFETAAAVSFSTDRIHLLRKHAWRILEGLRVMYAYALAWMLDTVCPGHLTGVCRASGEAKQGQEVVDLRPAQEATTGWRPLHGMNGASP